jgi:hypothetical protein
MIVSDIIKRVRSIASDSAAISFSDEDLVNWINDGVRECAMDNQLLQKTATQNFVIGTTAYNLPTDILKLHSIKVDGQKIRVLTMAEFEAYGGDSVDSGDPVVAYVWGGKANFYPKPTRAIPLVIEYTYDPALVLLADLTVTPPLPVGYHARLVDYCLAQVAQQDDDMPRYQLKMEEFRSGVHNLKDDLTETEDYYPMIGVSHRDSGQDWLEW